jgi:hypothetical protein
VKYKHIYLTLLYLTLPFFSLPVLQTKLLNRFLCALARIIRFCPRKCLFGVSLNENFIRNFSFLPFMVGLRDFYTGMVQGRFIMASWVRCLFQIYDRNNNGKKWVRSNRNPCYPMEPFIRLRSDCVATGKSRHVAIRTQRRSIAPHVKDRIRLYAA